MKKTANICSSIILSGMMVTAQAISPAFVFAEEPETVTETAENPDVPAETAESPETGNSGQSENSEETDPEEETAPAAQPESSPETPVGTSDEPTDPAKSSNTASAPSAQENTADEEKSIETQEDGPVQYDGKSYSTVQEAIDAIGDQGTGTIEITQSLSSQAVIRAGQTITINVASGVVWDNLNGQASGWNGSVLCNAGNLTVNSQGTIVADASVGQSFAAYNNGGTMTLNGGTYTSRHGDYIIMNTGNMVLDGGVHIQKTIAGSQSAVISGFLYGPSGSQRASLTVNNAVIDNISTGIGIKNDDGSTLVFNGGSISAGFCIQNNNVATINGGTFTATNSGTGGAAIYNWNQAQEYNQGDLTITGGDFYATNPGTPVIKDNRGLKDKGTIAISGGTYWANQPNVADNLVSPYVLRENSEGRWYLAIPVTSVTIDPEKCTVNAGQSITLTATVLPEDATEPKTEWTISDSELAEIVSAPDGQDEDPDKEGIQQTVTIRALQPGSVTVTTAADGISAKAEVTIDEKAALTLTPQTKELYPDETMQLETKLTPASIENTPITFVSSNPEIASVDEKGLVTAQKPGKATITASAEGMEDVSASMTVTVLEKKSGETGTPGANKPGNTPLKPAGSGTQTARTRKQANTGIGTMTYVFAGLLVGAAALGGILYGVNRHNRKKQ